MRKFDPDTIRNDFPIFSRKVNGKELVYLDNAATSQKPKQVINTISDFYSLHNANVHRGVHTLSEEATDMFEKARKNIAKFIGAVSSGEVIFTSGTTESINFVARIWGEKNLTSKDEILTLVSEHHSNFIPWQQVAKKTGAKFTVIELDKNGELDLDLFRKHLSKKVKIVAISHVSNVLGTIFPVKGICKLAHEVGALVSVDGAQAVGHIPVNVQSIDCDFYSFSSHKMFGPMGVGVLWARQEILNTIPPFEYGGGMIDAVSILNSTWAETPDKFEAGTPNVSGVTGLSAAVDYINKLSFESIREHEVNLLKYLSESLKKFDRIRILGPIDLENRAGLVSFIVHGAHAHDVASVLSTYGIAVRSGHHCTMPLHTSLKIPASVRASLNVYNTKNDIDKLIFGLKEALKIL